MAQFAVCTVNSCGLKEAQVESYLPGGINVTTWEGTLAPPGEYERAVCLRRRCVTLNYFDYLLLLWSSSSLTGAHPFFFIIWPWLRDTVPLMPVLLHNQDQIPPQAVIMTATMTHSHGQCRTTLVQSLGW